MRYFLRLAYLGCAFCGFQFQPRQRTVQGELNRAFQALFGVPCAITGCSRTDSGVHAEDFCATLDVPPEGAQIPPESLPRALARYLPDDISVFHAEIADATFHARHDVAFKEYVYRIYTAPVRDPFLVGRAWHYPYPLHALAEERMRRAGECLVGRHDFAAFKNEDGVQKDTVRNLTALTVSQTEREITVSVSADGFLYNMVRIITGTLMDVAIGRMEPEAVATALFSKERRLAGTTAPPDGLYLHRVTYLRPPVLPKDA